MLKNIGELEKLNIGVAEKKTFANQDSNTDLPIDVILGKITELEDLNKRNEQVINIMNETFESLKKEKEVLIVEVKHC